MSFPSELKSILTQLVIPIEAEYIGLRRVREITDQRTIKDGNPEDNSREISQGIMVEVLVNGQFGYCASASPTRTDLNRAVADAFRQAQIASAFALHRFDARARPKATGQWRSQRQESGSVRSARDIFDALTELDHRLRAADSGSGKIVQTQAALVSIRAEFEYASTLGTELQQEFQLTYSDFSAIAGGTNGTQRRSYGDSLQIGDEYLTGNNFISLGAHCQRVGEQALELLAAPDCPSRKSDILVMPDQMVLQIHESIGHPLELDRILGDERNYAGWSFVTPKDFGTMQYGSALLNVTFDPTVEGEFASYAYDDGCAPAERKYLIKDGKLIAGLGGIESQLRSGIAGVANFRASSWNRPAVDRMANLNVEPGTSSFQDMLGMIEDGILMETNRSWSIDDYRNKFQFGCEYAREIKNGKLGKVLKNPSYRGVTNPFWRGLKAVGNAATMSTGGSPFCGKAEPNQVIRVGHRSPVCLFTDIEVFGGGA